MPTYEFECAQHGVFELVRPLAELKAPAPCPDCSVAGRRLLSAPRVACVSGTNRRAIEINERSQHEPKLVRREDKPAAPSAPARASHIASSGRPWAIGH